MKKNEKIYRLLNEKIREILPIEFENKFGIKLITSYSLFTNGLVSVRLDNKPLLISQYNFIQAFEAGYSSAMHVVYNSDTESK